MVGSLPTVFNLKIFLNYLSTSMQLSLKGYVCNRLSVVSHLPRITQNEIVIA